MSKEYEIEIRTKSGVTITSSGTYRELRDVQKSIIANTKNEWMFIMLGCATKVNERVWIKTSEIESTTIKG